MSVMNQFLLAAVLAFFLGFAVWSGFLALAALFAVGFIAEFVRDVGKML
jgi:hypothetical protein